MAGGGADKKAEHGIRMRPVGAFLRWWGKKKKLREHVGDFTLQLQHSGKGPILCGCHTNGGDGTEHGRRAACQYATPSLSLHLLICCEWILFHIKPDLYFLYHQVQHISGFLKN